MKQKDPIERFAIKWAEATIGYAHASFFAGLHSANSAFETWEQACNTVTGTPKTKYKSWFRHPDDAPAASPLLNASLSTWAPWFNPGALPQAAAPMAPWMMSGPMFSTLWTDFLKAFTDPKTISQMMSPMSVAAASIMPMTYSYMAMGIPVTVAKPAAEANAAAYEAYESAQEAANEAIKSYQAAFKPGTRGDSPKSTADPDDPLALFRSWYVQPFAA